MKPTSTELPESQQSAQPSVPAAAPDPANFIPSFNPDGPTATDDVRTLLHEVCVLASTGIRLSRDRPNLSQDVDDEEDDMVDRLQMLRRTLDRIGWVSDVALRKLGGPGVFARAEDWMLPGV